MIFSFLYLISLLLCLPSSLFLLLIKSRILTILHYYFALHISTIYHDLILQSILWWLHLIKIWKISDGNTRKIFCNYLHFIIIYNRYLAFFALDSSFIFSLTSLSLSLSLFLPASFSPSSLTSSLSLLFSLYLFFHSHPLSLTFPFLYFTDPICV